MKKLIITSLEEMEKEKIKEDLAMTPNERLLYALRLTDLARSISPDNTLHSFPDDRIQWIELKPKDAAIRK